MQKDVTTCRTPFLMFSFCAIPAAWDRNNDPILVIPAINLDIRPW